ncbi:uncharacterized protein LOC116657503 [Camelus ferus]|uniref:Uncharacterized protein LOC116657503 n=1 Tax=Camelus ferus TaxID=419612 RepID=A0A8B8REU8_CAMFR|nr:uncharacterized protein LOC116657503 [Camelus ferus]
MGPTFLPKLLPPAGQEACGLGHTPAPARPPPSTLAWPRPPTLAWPPLWGTRLRPARPASPFPSPQLCQRKELGKAAGASSGRVDAWTHVSSVQGHTLAGGHFCAPRPSQCTYRLICTCEDLHTQTHGHRPPAHQGLACLPAPTALCLLEEQRVPDESFPGDRELPGAAPESPPPLSRSQRWDWRKHQGHCWMAVCPLPHLVNQGSNGDQLLPPPAAPSLPAMEPPCRASKPTPLDYLPSCQHWLFVQKLLGWGTYWTTMAMPLTVS